MPRKSEPFMASEVERSAEDGLHSAPRDPSPLESAPPQGFWQRWWSEPAGGREVLQLALPLVISTVSWTIMHFIDRMFLFWYSQDAMAAALPAGVLSFAVFCFPLGICQYVTTFVSQYHGARRPREIGAAVWQGVWVGVLATPLILATMLLAPLVFHWAGHEPRVVQFEIVYYQALCWGAPGFLISAALSSFFTGRGRTMVVMLVDGSAALLNIALDYAWIFGHWGFPEEGVWGAAMATNVALTYKMLVYLVLFLRRKERLAHLTLAGWPLNMHLFLRLLRFGFPAGAQLLLEVTGFTIFLFLVGKIGAVELAASGMALNVSTLAFMPIVGLGMAVTTLVGQHLGENRDDLAAKATWTSLALSTTYMAVLSLLYIGVPDLFLSGYMANSSEGDHIRRTAVILLRFVAAYNLFDALNLVFVSAIKGAGDTRFVLFTTIIMASALGLGSLAAVEWFGMGLYGLWTYVTVWLWCLGSIYMLRFLKGRWRTMRVIEPALQNV